MSTKSQNGFKIYQEILLLIIFSLLGAFFFGLIGLSIGYWLQGDFSFLAPDFSSHAPKSFLFAVKAMQSALHIGVFFVSGYLMMRRLRVSFLSENSTPQASYFCVVILLIVASPLVEVLVHLNQQMRLPEFLGGVELWMRQTETQAEGLIGYLLYGNQWDDLLLNTIMVALLPALGEEMLFRGALQNIFLRWGVSSTKAIWITAILFSAIHLQFYGFLPRMILGALFGYLYCWSGNLWLPIVGHFTNNFLGVIGAYVWSFSHPDLKAMNDEPSLTWWSVLIGIVASLLMLRMLYGAKNKISGTLEEPN